MQWDPKGPSVRKGKQSQNQGDVREALPVTAGLGDQGDTEPKQGEAAKGEKTVSPLEAPERDTGLLTPRFQPGRPISNSCAAAA